jgi:hypothetical protein
MITKCPHCDSEMTLGATTCSNCHGAVKYEYLTSPSNGRVRSKKEKWLMALFMWVLCFSLLWWVGESWFGGANFKVCFWLGLFGAIYMLVLPHAKKDD